MARTCLIVGAGMAGLSAACSLRDAGWYVTVVDKGRGVGGRMATRRIEDARFDHGAQFFTARDARFAARVREWERDGVVQLWSTSSDGEALYRGTDGMSAVAKHLARNLDVHTSTRIVELSACGDQWSARAEDGRTFEAGVLMLTAPPEQSLALCEPFRILLGRRLVQSLQSIHYHPCYSLMALLDGPSLVPPPGLHKMDGRVLLTVADNTQKGVSTGVAALTLHAAPQFTIEQWDEEPARVADLMMQAAGELLGSAVRTWQLHRWRYSHPARGSESPFLTTHCPAPLYFAGDAFGGPRVEGAFLSGTAAAEHLLASELEPAA